MFSFFTKKKPYVLSRKKIAHPLSPFRVQIIVGIAIVVIFSLIVACVWYIAHRPSFQIVAIEVVGGVTIPHTVIEEKTNSVLASDYLRLIPRRFIPFYPQDAITLALLDIPRMKQVHVEHVGAQKLAVAFEEYVPTALWCEATDSKNCLFIDSDGFAFTSAPALEGSAFVRYVDSVRKPELKTHSFDETFIKSSTQFTELLRDVLSLYVTHIEKIGEYDIEYTIAGGGVIKVALKTAPAKTFENLQTILSSKEFKHIQPGAFQYIDLRFGDKVFVSEKATVSSSTTSINE